MANRNLRMTFYFDAEGMIERVREVNEPDMTDTELTDPQLISDAKQRLYDAPVAGRDRDG